MATVNEYRDAVAADIVRRGNFAGISDHGRCIDHADGSMPTCAAENTVEAWKAVFDRKFRQAPLNPAHDIQRASVFAKTMALAQGVPEREVEHYLALDNMRRSTLHYLASEKEGRSTPELSHFIGASTSEGGSSGAGGLSVAVLLFLAIILLSKGGHKEATKADRLESTLKDVLTENDLAVATCEGDDSTKAVICEGQDMHIHEGETPGTTLVDCGDGEEHVLPCSKDNLWTMYAQ
jgi:hypothetical protein